MKAIATTALVLLAVIATAATGNAQTPVTAKVVFVVRAGNPKAIHDWTDLVRPRLRIITPDPKTSEAGKWNYLAAFAFALKQPAGSNAKALNFVAALLRNVPMLDADPAKAMEKFLSGTGDVLIASDGDARAAIEQGKNRAEVIVPPFSVVNVDELFGGWPKAQQTHFAPGGTFDQVYEPGLAQ